jgi:hypothetical protein
MSYKILTAQDAYLGAGDNWAADLPSERAVRWPCDGRAMAVRWPCDGRAMAVRAPMRRWCVALIVTKS